MRCAYASQSRKDILLKFPGIVRCGSSRVLCGLGPDELCWIEFRGSDREVKHVQSFVSSQKILNRFALVNGMTIPDQHDRSRNETENLSKKMDHLFAGETMPVRTNTQPNSFALGRDQQRSQQIETLVMIDGSPLDRRLAAPRPGPFERRNKRKTAFIFQNQSSAQLATLFLSVAVLLPSTARWQLRPDAVVDVVGVGCSNPSAASRARQRWSHIEHQTTARSPERSDPGSSNCLHIQRHRLLCPTLSQGVSSAGQIVSSDGRVNGGLSSSATFSLLLASDPRSAS